MDLASTVAILGFLAIITFLQFKYKLLEIVAGLLWIYSSLVIFSQVDVGFALIGLIPGLYFLINGAMNVIPEIDLRF